MNVTGPRDIVFPCREFPEDDHAAHMVGVYAQRQAGLYMQRVKVHMGRISAAQLEVLGETAALHTPGYPLHLTTRQDIELHGVKASDICEVQRRLYAAELDCVGSGGDSLRNVAVCPCSGMAAGTWELGPVADAIKSAAEGLGFIRELPRKFKISVSCSKGAHGRPWINDIGLVANADGSFRVIAGGSLGARPGLGMEVEERLESTHVVPFVVGAVRLFNEEGDRKVRGRARLRHVRERMGDEAFRGELARHYLEELKKSGPVKVEMDRTKEGKRHVRRLHPRLGDISGEDAVALARSAIEGEWELRLGFEHDVHVYGDGEIRLEGRLEEALTGETVVSCPGTSWCRRGVTDARALGRELAREGTLQELSVCISGCPNNCSHAAVADMGLVGRMKTVDGKQTECYRLTAGGGRGERAIMGVELHEAVPAGRVADVVRAVAERHAGSGGTLDEFVAGEGEVLRWIVGEVAGR